jgi:hypothetical protein
MTAMRDRSGDSALPAIEVEELVVRYGNVTAAGPVSFDVRQG